MPEWAEKSWEVIRAALSACDAPMAICGDDGRLTYVNPAGVKFWGFSSAQEMIGRPAIRFCRTGTKARQVAAALQSGTTWAGEGVARRRDGTRWDVSLSLTMIRDGSGQPARIVLSCQDRTVSKRAAADAAAHQQQLRALAGELSRAEERERQRIAGDLHDDVGQLLALAKLKMDMLGLGAAPSAEPLSSLHEVYNLVSEAANKLPTVVFDLNAPALYREGFDKALGQLAAEMGARHGLPIVFSDDGHPVALDGDMRIFLFRAVRELLVNVAKHARAKNVQVSMLSTSREVVVAVEDDGVGCDPGRLTGRNTGRGGFGLSNIWERVVSLGGRVEVRSRPGQGTRIALFMPLAAPGASAQMTRRYLLTGRSQ